MNALAQIRQLISHANPKRGMTATMDGDVVVLNFITRYYLPTHADPQISKEREPDTADYRIIINPSEPLECQIEDALEEIEKTPIEYV